MPQAKYCIACSSLIEVQWKFCHRCGARVDEDLTNEVRSINFLLGEIEKWHHQLLINEQVKQRLTDNYLDRKNRILESLMPPPVAPPLEVERSVQQSLPSPVHRLDPSRIEIKVGPPPVQIPAPNLPLSENQISQNMISQEQIPVAEAPSKPFAEMVAENIRTIFAVCIALFVGGVVLYYRNEIYFGLKQPITQAVLLAIATLGSLVTGWTLVRRTGETLAGRALTLAGSLLVPVNPWFLVRSGMIPDNGNGWILGLACAGLYGWTAYFLRERLFVYLSLATLMLSGCSAVYKFTAGSSVSAYAVVIMTFSVIYLLSERLFKPEAEGVEFSREKYGRAFFHVAQAGVALSLLFYTPLITLLPVEFVAVKQYFDPQSYNRLTTVWLALCGSFVYLYSGIVRKKSYFIYLSIAILLWAEQSLLYHLDASFHTGLLVFALTGLSMLLICRLSQLDRFFAEPIILVSTLIGWALCLYSIGSLLTHLLRDAALINWQLPLSFITAATIFAVETAITKRRAYVYPAWILFSVFCLLSLLKLDTPSYLLGALLLVPAYISLLLSSRFEGSWKSLSEDLHYCALLLTGSVILGSVAGIDNLFQHRAILVLLSAEVAGILIISGHRIEERRHSKLEFFIAGLFLTVSYIVTADLIHDRGLKEEYILPAVALWALALYSTSRISRVRQEMGWSFSLLASLISGILFLICIVIASFENISRASKIHTATAILLALVILGLKELFHLLASRSSIHSAFTALIGIVLSATIFRIAQIDFETGLLLELWLAALYIGLAYYLKGRKVEKSVFYPFEVIANLTAISCLLLIFVSQSDKITVELIAFLIAFSSALFYYISARLSGVGKLGRVYAHASAGLLLISTTVLFSYLGASNWSELAGLLIPILAIYLLVEVPLKDTVFSGSFFITAQVSLPVITLLGLESGYYIQISNIGAALFFIEVAIFYLLSCWFKKKDAFLYPSVIAFGVALWQLLLYSDINSGFYMAFYSAAGFSLLLLSSKIEETGFNWSKTALFRIANLFLLFSVAGATLQSFAAMSLNNSELNPLIGTLLMIIAIGALSSMISKDEGLSRLYRYCTFAVACFAYLVIGIRLGYDLVRQTEFYSIPVGTALLVAGYISSRRSNRNESTYWLWAGSILLTIPLLLHTLEYRFLLLQPSTLHDIGLILISLTLILGGIMLQLKAPTVIGGASFLIGLSVIVFGFVEWEQKWLSISMIVLALVIFGSSWIIYFFHKRNKLGQLRDQSRHVMEEFGKWK